MLPWGQMFPALRQGRSWFFGRPCGFYLCGPLPLSLLQNTLLVFSQSVSPKSQFLRSPIKLSVLCNINIYYYSTQMTINVVAKTMEIYSLMVLETKSPKSISAGQSPEVGRTTHPPQSLGENLSLFPQLLRSCCHSSAFTSRVTLSSLLLCVLSCLSFRDICDCS